MNDFYRLYLKLCRKYLELERIDINVDMNALRKKNV